jgi:hypothetical protein
MEEGELLLSLVPMEKILNVNRVEILVRFIGINLIVPIAT